MSGSIGGFSWGDLGNAFSGLFGGGAAASVDPANFAPAMSPGQIGTGGFTAPTSDDPLTSGSQTGNAGNVGISNSDVAKALGALGAGAKDAAAKTPTGSPTGGMNMAQSQAVRGGGAAGLDALVRMLNARRDALLPQPVGISASAQQRPTAGLLGF